MMFFHHTPMFTDRHDAGRRLADTLKAELPSDLLSGSPLVVLGLPRGGVVVACEVARALDAPLDVIVVRKLGVPWRPELAMGAIGEGGVRVVNPRVLRGVGIGSHTVEEVETRELAELARRLERLRAGRPAVPLTGATAIVVDDGIATGATAAVACRVAREKHAATVVLAVPVAPSGWRLGQSEVADVLVCVSEPESFRSVGDAYDDFAAVSDTEVVELLAQRAAEYAG